MPPDLIFQQRRQRAMNGFFRLLLHRANYPAALDYADSLTSFRAHLRSVLNAENGFALMNLVNASPSCEVRELTGCTPSELMLDVALLGRWNEVRNGLEWLINDFVPLGRLPLRDAYTMWEMEVFHERTLCGSPPPDEVCFCLVR
jgi:hypothetical protein